VTRILRRFFLLPEGFAHQVAQVNHADLAAHAGDFHRHIGRIRHLDLDLGIIHLVGLDALAIGEAGGLARFLAGQCVQQPLHRRIRRRSADGLAPTVPLQPHRFLDQIAHDLLDIAADIADLGELGRLDLDEWRVGQLRQAAADLGLAAAGGADHQDVLGRHLVAQLRGLSCCLRQRLRSATATARLASCWPMMCSSSAATIALGVRAGFIMETLGVLLF
jgi:hypothetical protein